VSWVTVYRCAPPPAILASLRSSRFCTATSDGYSTDGHNSHFRIVIQPIARGPRGRAAHLLRRRRAGGAQLLDGDRCHQLPKAPPPPGWPRPPWAHIRPALVLSPAADDGDRPATGQVAPAPTGSRPGDQPGRYRARRRCKRQDARPFCQGGRARSAPLRDRV